eukprot:EC723159.1.p1 GENE.EC723159.1~~EC723159.1.p1  ORF type:complete len:167 (+),score=21.75 EC723159.1:80-580(+)
MAENVTGVKRGQKAVFSKTFSVTQQELQLFELPSAVSAELASGSVAIVGDEGEDLVLTTSSRTYLLRKAETTNSLMLMPPVPPAGTPLGKRVKREVCATLDHSFELVEIAPRLIKLKALLRLRPFTAADEDPDETSTGSDTARGLFTLNDLLDNVQASRQQILEEL